MPEHEIVERIEDNNLYVLWVSPTIIPTILLCRNAFRATVPRVVPRFVARVGTSYRYLVSYPRIVPSYRTSFVSNQPLQFKCQNVCPMPQFTYPQSLPRLLRRTHYQPTDFTPLYTLQQISTFAWLLLCHVHAT